jgi:NTP pyrophosphatase (non-canonical NTP hydrolase)
MGEFEVLDSSEDIDYISEKELELQSVFGYKVDRQSYKELITKQSKQKSNQMEVNVTDQTTTFPYPVNKLKGNLMDNKGLVIETSFGKFLLNDELITWIMENVRVSMYNPSRSYVYNKAMSEAFKTSKTSKQSKAEEVSTFDLIRQWADERGIYKNGDTKTQYLKLIEEAGELSRAILKEDSVEFVDAIGDMVVVLTNLAALEGVKIEDCIASAYDVIKSRKGKMVNGTFVKENPQTQNGIEVSKSKLLQTL